MTILEFVSHGKLAKYAGHLDENWDKITKPEKRINSSSLRWFENVTRIWWARNPKKYVYNKFYNRTSFDIFKLAKKLFK